MEDVMHHRRQSSWKSWILAGAGGSSLVAAALFGACSIDAGKSSEIDSYDLAARTQSVATSRAFLEQYRTSHLVSDLIESLPPDVALQVCGELPAGTSSEAVDACKQMRDAVAAKDTAPDGPIQLAAATPRVLPTAASNCVARPADLPPDPPPAKATAKRSASAPTKSKAKRAPQLVQLASVGRGNKEVRH
jgi:hypothetical protein